MQTFNVIKINDIAKKVLNKDEKSIHLFDRELGQGIRREIENLIQDSGPTTVHFLDFEGICSIDYSCADELLGKLISRLVADEYGHIFFVLKNLNNNHQENIQVVLDRRKAGCLEQNGNGSWKYWGHHRNALLETLNVIMARGEITAKELRRELDLELTTSSTRLSQLYKSHLVNRSHAKVDGGGIEYLYKKLI